MTSMNLAPCGVRALRTILKLIFFTFLLPFSTHAQRWDTEGAQQAFQEARQKRSNLALEANPSIAKYLECAKSYREVYVKDPHYGRAGDAIYEEAVVYQEMGDRFSDLNYFRSAAKRFQLLIKEYGGNQNCPDALERMGGIYSQRLKNETSAQEAYNLLRNQYKNSSAARRLIRSSEAAFYPPVQAQKGVEIQKSTEVRAGATSVIKNIRFLSASDFTRVTIEMDKNSGFEKNRISSPDRIYLDIANARMSEDIQNRAFAVEDNILKQIRIGQYSSSVVRVVLDCSNAGDFSVVEQYNPYRIQIDLRRPSLKQIAPQTTVRSGSANSTASKNELSEKLQSPIQTASVVPKITAPKIQESAPVKTDASPAPSAILQPAQAASAVPKKVEPAIRESAPGKLDRQSTASSAMPPNGVESSSISSAIAETNPTSAEKAIKPAPPVAITPERAPKPALPTSQGNRTLTRMLGLKVGRIVIDPGHGGHDEGTIGPGGLKEKDFVLSLAISLQKMLQDKLGAEVFLTRTDDTFIPLEERTAIANQHRADLFISIHANSSKIPSISGVETYYLSFAKTNAEREIAARENATAISNVADLEDLVKKIAQADKSAESRELASTVQKKLYSGSRRLLPSTQNRGVRSAPFIVLIGANMPSVLTEVAFLSNPKDEKLLKKETNHEYLVKALYSGIEAYIQTLGTNEALDRQVQKQ